MAKDHADGSVTLTKEEATSVFRVLEAVMALRAAAKAMAKESPNPHGAYPICILMNADGDMIADDDGRACGCIPPFEYAGQDEKGRLQFHQHDQMMSPDDAAALLSVSKMTIRREVERGNLPEPVRLSPMRVAHRMDDLVRLYGLRLKKQA